MKQKKENPANALGFPSNSFEALSLVAQFNLAFVATFTLLVTIVVYLDQKK